MAVLVAVLSPRAQTATIDDWQLYAAHRARFTAAVRAQLARPGGRLCVLGAGACNDLDLAALAGDAAFAEIHLVDLDGKALARAVARPEAAVRARLHRHGDVDLSGLSARRLARWRRAPPDAAELEEVAGATLDGLIARLPGPFDVVVSACVMTQMAFALREALGDRHPTLEAARHALLRTHLSTLVSLTAEGGTALFASDVVSSNFYPLDELPPDADLARVLDDVVAKGAAYYAANPTVVRPILAEVGTPELLPPWLWTGPLARTYLVYALRVQLED
ncbi:MAG TPA: hypothetical protein VHJ20_23535 [Polyangia bacterium]|nr:hypothetical protein [Polyangia bacterium]